MTKTIIIRIIALIIVGAIIVAAFLYITRKPKEETTGVQNVAGYSTITSVAGCTFMVNGAFTEKATAVTQITDGVNFAASDFYSYKNGKDQYMLFCLDNASGIVIAVEKGTNFNLANAEDPDMAVTETDIMGIWFGTDKEGVKLDKSSGRCEGNVTAQVVITNDLYNDFIGKIVTLNNKSEEWAMFVGIPGNRYKNIGKEAKEGIETIADSFMLSNNTGEFQEPEYAVVIDGTIPSENRITSTSINEVEVEVKDISGNTVSDNIISDNAISENTVSEDVVSVSEDNIDIVTISENESVSENTLEQGEDKVTVTEEPEEEPEEEPSDTVHTASTVIKDWDDNKAYTSSIYSMLNIGQTGLFDTMSKTKNGAEQLMVRLEGINDSKVTSAFISNAVDEHKAPLDYFVPTPGCHWESAVYSVNYAGVNDRPYINVKLVGADGKALKFRGIKYPTMAYDLYTGVEKDTWRQGNIVYYAVPNGCTEYVLRIGDGDDITGWKSAYYYINREK